MSKFQDSPTIVLGMLKSLNFERFLNKTFWNLEILHFMSTLR